MIGARELQLMGQFQAEKGNAKSMPTDVFNYELLRAENGGTA